MDDKLQKMENETMEEYQVRLSIMKLTEGYDIDWEDVKELLKSEEHRDTLRRKGYGIVLAKEVYDKKIKELNDIHKAEIKAIKRKVEDEFEDKRMEEISKKVLQLELEKVKLKDQRNDLNAIKRDVARVEHIIECVSEKIDELNNTKPLLGDIVIEKVSDCTGVCLLSDIHLGVDVDNILTKYNPNICKEKMNYFVKECIKYGKLNNIDEMYVLGLGDYITGIIHTTNRYESRVDVVEQVSVVSELISEAINEISKKFKCKVALLTGNHDEIRMGGKDDMKLTESFALFTEMFVKRRLEENENVSFIDNIDREKEIIMFEMRGFNFIATHGQHDKDKNLDRTTELEKDKLADFIIRGHYHNPSLLYKNHTCVITNGCFSGENYTKRKRLYCPPIQKFLIFDDNGLRCNYDILLDNYKRDK